MSYLVSKVDPVIGEWTYGNSTWLQRFGGAYKGSRVASLTYWCTATNKHVTRNVKCASYRKAQRKLLQWIKGYNV